MLEGVEVSLDDIQLSRLRGGRVGGVGVPSGNTVELDWGDVFIPFVPTFRAREHHRRWENGRQM